MRVHSWSELINAQLGDSSLSATLWAALFMAVSIILLSEPDAAVATPIPCDPLTGHFDVDVAGRTFAQDFAVQSGGGRTPLADVAQGTLTLRRIIDTPCPDGCILNGTLPNTALVGITGTFSGALSSTFAFTVPPVPPLAEAGATYAGPGAMAFTTESTRLVGVENFSQAQGTSAALTVDTPVAYTLTVNGFAFLPPTPQSSQSSASATLRINASVLPGQNFTVPCCVIPEPTSLVLFGTGLAALIWVARKQWRSHLS